MSADRRVRVSSDSIDDHPVRRRRRRRRRPGHFSQRMTNPCPLTLVAVSNPGPPRSSRPTVSRSQLRRLHLCDRLSASASTTGNELLGSPHRPQLAIACSNSLSHTSHSPQIQRHGDSSGDFPNGMGRPKCPMPSRRIHTTDTTGTTVTPKGAGCPAKTGHMTGLAGIRV